MTCPRCLQAPLMVLLFVCAVWVTRVSSAPASPPVPRSSSETVTQPSQSATVTISGPLRSFLRMAGISQKISPDEVLPLLARNVYLRGYEGQGGGLHPTEFLLLLRRYVQQARELSELAGPEATIRVTGCDDAQRVLDVLGYRVRPDCGQRNTYVETADAQRAFLTIDSGFPLNDLEKTLQGGPPFAYAYANSQVPVLLNEHEWTLASDEKKKMKSGTNLVDVLLHDPLLSRLYTSWSRLDPQTVLALRQSTGLRRLVPLAPALDYYGSYIRIRSGRVDVPGGPGADSAWRELVGANPDSPGEFVPRLLAKDGGWLAAYFDSLARANASQQAYFTQSPRLKQFYEALRGKDGRPAATLSVFRPNPELLFLITRLDRDANGEPHVPGNLQTWRDILDRKSSAELVRDWGLRIKGWNDPEGLFETMFAFSRVPISEGPPQLYLALCEIDRGRSPDRRLSPQTVTLLADKFPEYGSQYLIFSEFPGLSDASIALFLSDASSVSKIPDRTLRGNAMGIFQANVGLWEILARQGEIASADQDASWQRLLKPFSQIASSQQLFDAGRKSVDELARATSGNGHATESELIDAVAGPRQTVSAAQQTHEQVAEKMRAVLDDQRLVSLDTLFALGDGLAAMSRGSSAPKDLASLAEQLQDFQMPRPIFSRGERAEWAAGIYDNRHTELQMRTDIAKLIQSAKPGDHIEEARSQLVPFLRDTLVGLNYAYYEPPGSQALHNNPLLVRSHDFSGESIIGMEQVLWQTPRLIGSGSPAGGGAHLVGSLADLPYVLGRMEQDFVSPENVQALIWSDLVPGVYVNAVLPRWWNVSANELHAVALYQRAGEELVADAAKDAQIKDRVVAILSTRMVPLQSSRIERALGEGRTADAAFNVSPADDFYLAAEYQRTFPAEISSCGAAGHELDALSRDHPADVNWDRISQDFGVPHPAFQGTYARELLNVPPLPMFEGYSSRLLAETWDSPNLYWARLADELGYPPAALNRLVPQLTLRMVAKIFATDLDDSEAILRAVRETGEEFRKGQLAAPLANNGASASPADPRVQ